MDVDHRTSFGARDRRYAGRISLAGCGDGHIVGMARFLCIKSLYRFILNIFLSSEAGFECMNCGCKGVFVHLGKCSWVCTPF